MNIDKNTWIISDTHFGHMNMINLCGRSHKFNELIAKNWDKMIKPDENVLHLGDVAFWHGPTQGLWMQYAQERPGNKFLIKGNHDKENDFYYKFYGYEVVSPFIVNFGGKRIMFSHEPLKPNNSWSVNIHGHIHNNTEHRVGERDFELGSRHINVSIDVMDMKPIRLGELLDRHT